jgi:hypothetical protein
LLPVHGQLTSIDILFAFVDHYHNLLAISPEQDIDVEELSYALNQRMLRVCASVASAIADPNNRFVSLNLDSIQSYVHSKKVELIPPSSTPVSFSISSNHFPIRSVFDALRNLIAANIKAIERPFARRYRGPVPGDNWIWSGYTPDDEVRNITLMLERALPEYSEFVLRNRFKFPESRYLDTSTAIIMEYEPVFSPKTWAGPVLRELYLYNQSQTLPKLTVSVIPDGKSSLDASNFPQVTYNGINYRAITSSESLARYLFSNTPMLTLLYRMLEQDLSEHYGMSSFSSHY